MPSSSSNRIWRVLEPDESLINRLVKKAGVGDVMARLLVNRGICDEDAARIFLNPLLKDMPRPDALPDVEKAVDRIIKAIRSREEIVVYGDYDADGVTATALLKCFFGEIGVGVKTFQPHRVKDGYGLSINSLENLYNNGARLVVAVDLGISSTEAVDWASERGMDVIIVDHHHLPDSLPKALATLDPLTSEKAAQFHCLSGVGLAFYLAYAVLDRLKKEKYFGDEIKEPDLRRYLDLVAIGSIADMVPLTGLNRIIVTKGLEQVGAERRHGVAALKAVTRFGRNRITAEQVAFQIAPRLNAAGRMDDATPAVELLTAENAEDAKRLARKLEDYNQERQRVEMTILNEALATIEKEKTPENRPAFVLAADNWHAGVIGIVASRVVDQFGIPTAIISLDGNKGKGSMRSVPGINAWQALDDCRDCLVGYGGHEMAGGFIVERDAVAVFRERFCEAISKQASKAKTAGEPVGKKLQIDMEMEIEDLDAEFVRELAKLAPHGVGNPEPLFLAKGVKCESARVVGAKHLRFQVPYSSGGNRSKKALDAIAFGMANRAELLDKPIDVVFAPLLTIWEGWERIELKIRDFRAAENE